jgi:hypothetical protein
LLRDPFPTPRTNRRYKTHWRHLLKLAFIVYLTVAVIGTLLVAVLTWLGALIALLISLIALFWLRAALVKAVEDVRDGRAAQAARSPMNRLRRRPPELISIRESTRRRARLDRARRPQDPRRHQRITSRRLLRYLEEDPHATIEEATLAASSLVAHECRVSGGRADTSSHG